MLCWLEVVFAQIFLDFCVKTKLSKEPHHSNSNNNNFFILSEHFLPYSEFLNKRTQKYEERLSFIFKLRIAKLGNMQFYYFFINSTQQCHYYITRISTAVPALSFCTIEKEINYSLTFLLFYLKLNQRSTMFW